jgi:hypothetical protein
MKVLNRVMAAFAAVLLTVTAFALPDPGFGQISVAGASCLSIPHVAKTLLVSAMHQVALR